MKPLFTALAISLLAVSAASASGVAATDGANLRTVELTNAREIHDAGSSSISVTVGTPKEVSIATLPPRDRAEAGYKGNATVTQWTFPSAEPVADSRR
jgi:hypothetical protein